MKKTSSKALREGSMMVALTAVLLLLTRYMPLFSVIGTFVCGIPLAALGARNGFRVLVPAAICVFVVSIFVNGEIFTAVTLMLMSVLPGAVCGYMLGRRSGFFKTLFAVCTVVCIGWLFELLTIELMMENGIDEMFTQLMEQTRQMMEGVVNEISTKAPEIMGIYPENFTNMFFGTMVQVFRLYFPGFVVISSAITGYIIMRISAFVIRRAHICEVEKFPFSHIKAPKSISWVAIICFLLHIFTQNGTQLWGLLSNIVVILYAVLGVCGLSVIDFKFKTKVPSGPLRMLIYITAFMLGGILLSLATNILIIIGILDSSRDFRHLEVNANIQNGGGF